GYSGLQIIDVSNPSSPVLAGACDTPGILGLYASMIVLNLLSPSKSISFLITMFSRYIPL
ncbi:MAG TPA: hypothetical protein EYP23_02285, partial [Thermoplasmata archaeon]|nr:hypothetical protein [Thermoplasmata archaeon]